MNVKPALVTLFPEVYKMTSFKTRRVVKLSDMKEYFIDKKAVHEILASGKDPIIFEYCEYSAQETAENLNFGITTIYPGKIGKEYYMTRGHFHAKNAAEVYVGISGHGMLLMQTREGEVSWLEIEPYKIVYVPPNWGHKTINTGTESLVVLFVYRSDAGHEYESLKKKGFAKIVIEEEGVTKVVDKNHYLKQ